MIDDSSIYRPRRSSEEIWLLSYADLITNLLVFFLALLAAAEISRPKMEQVMANLSGKTVKGGTEELRDELVAHARAEGLEQVVNVDLTAKGVELSINSGVVFTTGSDQIPEQWAGVLRRILQKVVPYAGRYEFAVEGHTDDTPIRGGGRFASNWDLSSARAIKVLGELESVGIPRSKLHVEGYADTVAITGKDVENLSASERRDRSRRVVIRIY